MSQDIRSFFSVANKKPASKPTTNALSSSSVVKRKSVVISSDEEDALIVEKDKIGKSKVHRKRRRTDSDEESTNSKNVEKSQNKSNYEKSSIKSEKHEPRKLTDIKNLFGNEPSRVEHNKPNLEKNVAKSINSRALLDDDDFETSILSVTESDLYGKEESKESPRKLVERPDKSQRKTESSPSRSQKKAIKLGSPKKQPPEKSSPFITPTKDVHKREIKKSPLSEFGLNPASEAEQSKSLEIKHSRAADLESSNLSDEDRHDRKRLAAILYQKYKNRQSVISHGCKEVPKGAPNCLAGLTFLITGVLESLERDEATAIIKELGGKVSTTVGKRLNYLLAGEEAGPKKLATAVELEIKVISEDELFDLIRRKSNQADENKKQTNSDSKKATISKLKRNHDENDSHKSKLKEPKISMEEEVVVNLQKKTNVELKQLEVVEFKPPEVYCKDAENLAWVDKYKPTSVKQIIGQQGAASNCVKLMNWLSKWHSNHDGKKKLQRPNPWAKNDDGSYYKAALLSGPPGIGKTTTATLVCKELGFDAVEFNASDTRSKKLLKQEVSELLSNKSLYGYFHGNKEAVSKNHILLMDEVDGMAGNEDRGGIQELIALIKDSSIPIICMCNDRNHEKMRSLGNYCYDLRFNKPRMEQIRSAMMSVCFKEKLKLPAAKIDEMIAATNNDIRQTLNHLSLLNAGKELYLEAGTLKTSDTTAKKDLKLGPWEVVRKVFSADDHKKMSLSEKADLFFHDYSLGPLFVQQNYLSVLPKLPKHQISHQVALAANSLSLGDMIDKRIRSQSAWSLLPVQAMFSSVMPGEYMAGNLTGQINFPGWLGKNSKRNKRNRLAQELHDHTRIRTSGSRLSVRLDYAQFLLDGIVRPLNNRGIEGIADALNVIKEYRLLREDLESLIELTSWPGKKNPMNAVDSKIKAALTRAYNKEVMPYSYSVMAGVKKKQAETKEVLEDLEGEDEENTVTVVDSSEEEDENLENDALIKAKKPAVQKAVNKADGKKSTASSSKSKKGAAGSSGYRT